MAANSTVLWCIYSEDRLAGKHYQEGTMGTSTNTYSVCCVCVGGGGGRFALKIVEILVAPINIVPLSTPSFVRRL